jgi:predicted ATPase
MTWRAKDLFGGKFLIDETNSTMFDLLCYYFSDDKNFIAIAENIGVKNPSLDKGIFLAGNFGVGKTWLMSLFRKNQRQVFFLESAKAIANSFEKNGEGEMEKFIFPEKNAINDAAKFFQPFSGLCVDDIGTEDLKNNFGNKKNVLGDLIELRYSKNFTGTLLHATTNLSAKQLEDFYGGRITSRMKEIFNWIVFDGKDRRR